MTSHYAIDYFATLGRESGSLKCKTFPYHLHEDDPPLSAPEVWQEAITDIILVSQEDQIPDNESWTFVSETIGQVPLEYPWIAFRKRKFSGRLDHITQLKFISSGEPVPKDFELLRTTASGKQSGFVKPFGFIALKRALADSYAYFNGESMIYDICAQKKSLKEDIPERYIPIERDSQGAWSSLSLDLTFAVRNLPAMGLCNLSYEAVTLDRYPRKDISPNIQLPEEALPVFAFPRNLRLELALNSEYPLPVFYTFVFTDQDGHHMFAACLKFFEHVPLSALEPIAQEIYGNTDVLNLPPDASIFCPKVICVLSHKPFYRAMGRYLKHIYSLSLSSSICPLEHFITAVVSKIPLPCHGGRPFHVVLDGALIAPTSRPMKPVVFKMPNHRFFPLMDLDFAGPLRCLSVDLMLAVFVLMLREAKIVFLSSSNTMLTEAMETLRCLLFPLTWSSCFVSRLPKTLGGLLQAPGGFMVGLHIEPKELMEYSSHQQRNQSNKQFLQELMKKYIQYMHFDYPLLAGTYVIDLNCNLAYQFNGKYCEVLPTNQIDNILKTLPNGPKLRLRTKLFKIAEEYHIAPQMAGLEELDSAFDFQHQQNESEKLHWEMFPTLEIRDSFMSFMIDLLGEYPKYMKPPNIELIEDTYRTFQEEFNIPDYIHECGENNSSKILLEYLMETQMFSVLIQSRSEATAEPLVFFEQAAQLQRELGLSAGGHASTSKINGTTAITPASIAGNSHGVCELPEPLYVLYEAENRWSNLSKVMQQQILQQSFLYNFEDKTLKQYSLKYISTSSLATIRSNLTNSSSSSAASSNNISEAFYAVNNQKLLDLLIFIDFSNGMTDIDEEFNITGGNTTTLNTASYAVLRNELDRGEDLHLADANYGALILPGPIIRVTYDEHPPKGEDSYPHASTLPQYSYKAGWPQLNVKLLNEHNTISHPKIDDLIQERAFAINKINPIIRLLIRSPSERLTAENVTKLRKPPANTTIDPNTYKVHKDITTALSAILDISSLSMTMLTLRVINKVKPISDILQILGIIAQIESSGIHYYIHENIWRSILVGCSVIGGDITRRISVVIRDCILSLQFHLDALTYGQFIKANQAAKIKATTAKVTGDIFDQYLHLEELGYLWYHQKTLSPPLPSIPSQGTSSKDHHTPTTAAASAQVSNVRGKGPVKSPLQEALDQAIKQLILQKSEGLMPFYRPRQTSATCVPCLTNHFFHQNSLPFLKNELQNRLNAIYVQVKDWSNQQRQQQRAISLDKKAAAVSRPSNAFSLSPSVISPIAAMSKFGKGFFSGGGGGLKSVKNSPVLHTTNEETVTTRATISSVTPPPLAKGGFSFAKFLGGGNKNSAPNSMNQRTDSKDRNGSSEIDQVNLKLALEEVAVSLPSPAPPALVSQPEKVDTTSSLPPAEVHIVSADPPIHRETTSATTTPIKQQHTSDSPSIIVPSTETTPNPEASSEIAKSSTTAITEETKPLSLAELQDRLLETFATEFSQRSKSLALHNYNPCRECGYVMMDEELMNCWFRASSIDVHKPSDRLRSCRDLNEDKGIVCPECERNIQPKLFITCYSLKSQTTADDANKHSVGRGTEEDEEHQQLHELWKQEVLFINPFLLRFEVEELLIKFGERINQIDWLFSYYPAIVWNILWYTNRCHLPCGFTSSAHLSFVQSINNSSNHQHQQQQTPNESKKSKEDYFPKLYPRKEYEILHQSSSFEKHYEKDDLQLPIIIGWRESVVRAKLLRLLQGKSGNYLDIRDLYPDLSRKEFEIITGPVLSNLDGSPFGMRQAMLHFSDCLSLFEPILTEYNNSRREKQLRQQRLEKATIEEREGGGLEEVEGSKKEGNGVNVAEMDSDDEEANESDDSDVQQSSVLGGTKRSIGSTTVSYRSATRKRDLETARMIYLNLLILSIHFAKFQLFDPTKTGFNRDLEREAEFDRIYIDCVKCVLSKNDFEKLQTTEDCLSECTKVHQRTNIVRGIFGLLP